MKKILSKEEFNKLLKKIGQKNKRALKILYDMYGKLIYFSALSVCKSSSISDEIVNDVLFKIWQLAGTTKLEIENPEGWIYKISVNLAKNRLERNVLPIDENIVYNKNEIAYIIEEDAFYSYISDLTEEEQAILVARFMQDMKFEDIANMLELPVSSLTTKYYRTLKKIKKRIEK